MKKLINSMAKDKIHSREITEEMKSSYIDYAMSVIVARALPDIRDGLKPVHRRILYSMLEEGLRHNAKFRKSAAVTGSTLAKYHPHGDVAVYNAMVRLAQDFSSRYTLIKGQGNFGSIDDDPPAAQRYTEAKLSLLGEEMLRDIEKNTVDFVDNYDGTRKEPVVLPSPLPQLILNGSLGIAVGMATSIPPHNLSEVCDALIYLLENKSADTEDIFQFIQGPDFPTGGIIFGQKEMISTYSQGKGPIITRGKVDIVDDKKGRTQIIITEIPYLVSKSTLVEQFAKLVRDKKVQGIKDIRDESDKEGMRIVFDLQKDFPAQRIINKLYKFTDLQKTFHINLLALVNGIEPKVLSLVDILNYFIEHRKEVITRRAQFDLEKAKARAHILEGLKKCLDKIDEVIKIIKSSENREDAQSKLIKRFKLTEIQANAILETKLSALAKLERKKIEQELKDLLNQIEELKGVLKSPQKVKKILKKELEELKQKYGDKRKTQIMKQAVQEIAEEDLIPHEETMITLTTGGYIKRINPSVYKIQKRGGKGILGMKTMQEDIVEHFLLAETHDHLLFFTDSGKVFRTMVYEIPEASRVSRGRGLMNFIEITSEEKILSLMTAGKKDQDSGIKNLVIATKDGIIKKTDIEDFKNIRKSGLIAINLRKNDLVRKACKTTGENDIMLITRKGQAIRFKEKEIRAMQRTASGVKGIRLKKADNVISMEVINPEEKDQYLLVVTEKGYGKRTLLKEYKKQARAGTGIKTANITSKTGDLVCSTVLTGEEEDLIVISQKGHIIRTKIDTIAKLSRATQGVRIMKMAENDKIASIICV
ncbi:MAG: DNA gyrase subunit A [Candidatus Pacebacteria bacterium]|nr:DNA gyrase subunit A [Candidatus Paceibacterota bacterium]